VLCDGGYEANREARQCCLAGLPCNGRLAMCDVGAFRETKSCHELSRRAMADEIDITA
jgi:hypothetical protein